MKHLSLFSGIGGIDLAAEWAGFESAIMVERDPYCQQVLKKNFPTTQIFDDVTTFNGLELRGTIDLISAGFPCQPHSLAGKRKASADERDLWGEVVRIVGEVQPRWFLGENVPGLLSSESGRFFGRVVNDLVQMGYRVGWACYGAKDVGGVHRRNRVFIIAYSDLLRRGEYVNQKREQSGGWRETQCLASGYDSSLQSDVAYSASKSSNGGGLGEQLCSESPAQEFGGGDSKYNVAYSEHVRCEDIQEEGFERQDNEEREEGRAVELEGSGLREYVSHPEGKPRLQAHSTTCSIGSERYARKNIGGRHWQPISGGNWKEWDTCPIVYETRSESRVRGKNDGLPHRVDRLKCLGNAVVPQQIYPILEEMARFDREL